MYKQLHETDRNIVTLPTTHGIRKSFRTFVAINTILKVHVKFIAALSCIADTCLMIIFMFFFICLPRYTKAETCPPNVFK